jgi:hypothetical protein
MTVVSTYIILSDMMIAINNIKYLNIDNPKSIYIRFLWYVLLIFFAFLVADFILLDMNRDRGIDDIVIIIATRTLNVKLKY